MNTSTIPSELLVPPRRLGQLLAGARVAHGFSLEEAAESLGPKWNSVELLEVETGHRPIADRDLAGLTDLYGIETSSLIPQRSSLVLDVNEGILQAGSNTVRLVGESVHRRDVLANYLSMIYSMRDIKPGRAVPLRLPDLEVLSSVLGPTRREIEDELRLMMVSDVSKLDKKTSRLRGRLLIPVIGVVVAVTVAGTLLLVSDDSGASELPKNSAAAITQSVPTEIGNAVMQERLPDGTPGEIQVRN